MNYADIKQYDVANGPGVRVSLFVSGCTHQCKNCFNKEAWDFKYGKPFTNDTIDSIIEYCGQSYVKGLTILGGEPMEPSNQKGILPLIKKFKEIYPDKSLWIFSGYDFENDILNVMSHKYPETKQILSYVDVIVDGKFIEELQNRNLRFKGSSNQRTILVQESLKNNTLVLWDDVIHTEFKTNDMEEHTYEITID
ncbi:MAG: anaerobic ribonucleoside-triphosphate reductase activating protein [Lachnospiraceae bacterium]|nr:anaerobic ribonucleoside-triphosphate reductase activating protein [Lachnospiraceae bacterium]